MPLTRARDRYQQDGKAGFGRGTFGGPGPGAGSAAPRRQARSEREQPGQRGAQGNSSRDYFKIDTFASTLTFRSVTGSADCEISIGLPSSRITARLSLMLGVRGLLRIGLGRDRAVLDRQFDASAIVPGQHRPRVDVQDDRTEAQRRSHVALRPDAAPRSIGGDHRHRFGDGRAVSTLIGDRQLHPDVDRVDRRRRPWRALPCGAGVVASFSGWAWLGAAGFSCATTGLVAGTINVSIIKSNLHVFDIVYSSRRSPAPQAMRLLQGPVFRSASR